MTASRLAGLALALLLSAPTSLSQTGAITGRVVDAETTEPLPGATIRLDGTGLGAATNRAGRFTLAGVPAGAYRLAVSMVGYRTDTQDIILTGSQVLDVTVRLAARVNVFDAEVVVTATRTEQAVATAPASISVVSGPDLRTRPVGDLTDALRDLPGVSIAAGSQGRREIQIRGMDASYTLVLVDGKRVNSSEAVFRHNDYDIGLVPVEAIDRIEVVRGAMSALYGSEALGGVVNIVTRPAASDWRASVNTDIQAPTAGGGGQEARASVYASGALVPGRLGLRLTGSVARRGAWHGGPEGALLNGDGSPVTRPDGSVVDQSDLATLEGRDDATARATLAWEASPRQTVEVEGGYAYQSRFGEYYVRGWGDADSELNRTDLGVSHRTDLGWAESTLRTYGERVTTGDDGLTQTNLVVEGNGTAPLGRHRLTIGAEARWIDLEAPDEFASGGAAVRQQALYIQDEVGVVGGLTVLGGARLDHHQAFGLQLTPRLYAVAAVADGVTIKGGVGTAFKAPTLRQLSDESIVRSCRGACVVVGSSDLEPEMAVTYEASVNLSRVTWGGSVTVFQNDINDLIDTPRGSGIEPVGTDAESGLPVFVPRNVNRARLRGLEATARVRIGQAARLTGNYTLLDARDLDAGVRLDYRPRHTANGRVDGVVTDAVSVFLRGQYVGTQASGEVELDPYALFDVGAGLQVREGLLLNAGVQNVANTRTDDAEANYSFVERGRTVSLGLNVRF